MSYPRKPISSFVEGEPRLHYLEWNPAGEQTIVLLHGQTANAWWWCELAQQMPPEFRLLALDQRGHGDSAWMRPAAYSPDDYAADLMRFIEKRGLERPLVVGHSMGGLNVLAFARNWPGAARGAVAVDVAISSTRGRDRFLQRLRTLPTVAYPDLKTARERFRLMPREGEVAPKTLHAIAENSLAPTPDGGWTLKFDRETFLGSDGIDLKSAIRELALPTLLVRGGRSRIMTAEAAAEAAASNPLVRLTEIPDAHHHILLEKPKALAGELLNFMRG